MSNFSFSIVIPVYKTDLSQFTICLKSVLDQDCSLLKEVIIVDDGNPEEYVHNLKDIISNLDNKNISVRLVNVQSNSGLANARKVGYEVSTGEIINFVDADDWISPDFISTLNECFSKNPDVEMVSFGYHSVRDCNSPEAINKQEQNKPITYKKYVLTDDVFIRNYIADHGTIFSTVWSSSFKKNFLKDNFFWNTLNEAHEDEYFFTCILEKCPKILVIDKKIYSYRVLNPKSITWEMNRKKNKYSSLLSIEKWFTFFENHNLWKCNSVKNYWMWLCIINIFGLGAYVMRKNINSFPTNKEIKLFIEKNKMFSFDKYKNMKLLYIKLVLSSKVIEWFLMKVKNFARKIYFRWIK